MRGAGGAGGVRVGGERARQDGVGIHVAREKSLREHTQEKARLKAEYFG